MFLLVEEEVLKTGKDLTSHTLLWCHIVLAACHKHLPSKQARNTSGNGEILYSHGGKYEHYTAFWDTAPCSPVEVDCCLRGTYCHQQKYFI
jgi:hypothetical protein